MDAIGKFRQALRDRDADRGGIRTLVTIADKPYFDRDGKIYSEREAMREKARRIAEEDASLLARLAD